jgi:hypothetical protein
MTDDNADVVFVKASGIVYKIGIDKENRLDAFLL